MYRGVDYSMDQVLLPVPQGEQDVNNGSLQPDCGQRHQCSKLFEASPFSPQISLWLFLMSITENYVSV